MKIIVLLKQTPDTEASISTTDNNTKIDHSSTKFIVNPYDEFAIEEALKIKQKLGSAEVVIATFSAPESKDRVLKALAMGADRAVIVNNQGLEDCDSSIVSKVLSKLVETESADLVLCGKQGIDDDNMHVGIMTAELLGWPHVNGVCKMELEGTKVNAEREIEGGQLEVYEVTLPAVFGAHKSLNTPRYASLPGIMKAKKKPLDLKVPSDLGLDIEELKAANLTLAESYSFPEEKPAGKVFKDKPVADMVSEVVQLLRKEAKVI